MQQLVQQWFLEHLGASYVLSIGLIAARITPMTIFVPWISLKDASAVTRVVLVVALSLAFFSVTPPVTIGPALSSPWVYSLAVLRETMVGFVFALTLSLPIWAMSWAGRFIDIWRGASMAEVIVPFSDERTSPVGDFLLMSGVAIFLSIGGHIYSLEAFADSLSVVPIGELGAFKREALLVAGGRLSAAALLFALKVALPIAIALLLVDFGLGLLVKTAPQISVFFAGMPVKAWLGVFVLATSYLMVVQQFIYESETSLGKAIYMLKAIFL